MKKRIKREIRLQQAFEYVRRTFFPRWDKQHQWGVKLATDLCLEGECDLETKTILLKSLPRDDNDLYTWLIHEICHAIPVPGHAKKWFSRMMKASNTAWTICQHNLATKIGNEARAFYARKNLRARDVYQLIEDIVIRGASDRSYEDTIDYVAREYGLCNREEAEKRFKRCKAVYDKAVRSKKAQDEILEKTK